MTHPTHQRNTARWIQPQVLVQETRDDGVKGPTESKLYTLPLHTHTHTHIRTHTHACVHTHTRTHTHARAHTHACTHTQAHTYLGAQVTDRVGPDGPAGVV